MDKLEVGDLVRDKLNTTQGNYGIGVVIATEASGLTGESVPDRPSAGDQSLGGKRYDVYFTKFERTITFHGDYLEKV